MKNHKKLDTTKLLNSLVAYIFVAIFLFFILIIISVALARLQNQTHVQDEHNHHMDSSLHHVISHFTKDYIYRTRHLVETTDMSELIKNRDREGLLKLLSPMFKLMQEESPYFTVLHVHLADGRSLLRVHRPDAFGDDIATKRVMLREIHKNHQIISGYETGMYGNTYRVISPVFDKDGTYLGAVEIGVNPNFIIEAIDEINGFSGVVFIKEDELKLYSQPSEVLIDGYRLQTKIDPELKDVFNVFKKNKKILDDHKINVGKLSYLTHVVMMKNYMGEDSVKLIFFQDVTHESLFFNLTQYVIYLGMLFVLGVLIKFIYDRVRSYQEHVTVLYENQILKLEKNEKEIQNSQKYHKALFDTMPNILIITNGEMIEDANSVMLEFFGFSSIEGFRKKHNCICDFFLEIDNYLRADMNGKTWLEHIRENPNEIHKVSMLRDGEKRYFLVYFQELSHDEHDRYLVSFVDITELEKLNERVDIAIKGTRDGLWDWNIATNKVYFSPRWKGMLGYKDEELSYDFDTWKSRVHPDDLEVTINGILATHEKPNVSYEGIHRLKHKDGHWVWVLSRGQTIFDTENKAIRMVGFHTDITEIKELEIKLLSAKLEFDMFMRFIPARILIKDSNGAIIYANELANEFFNQESVVGKTAYDLLPFEVAKETDSFSANIMKYGQHEEVNEFIDAQGERIIVRTLGFKIEINGSVQIGLVILDITQSYLDKQELHDQEEIMIAQSRHAAMGEMISMIAHQWRQPISVIAMDANNILVDIELDLLNADDLYEASKDIINQTQELSKTIDDFRDFFKPNKSAETLFLYEIIDDALGVIRKSLENNNIEVTLDIDKSIKLQTYARELMQVVINIMKNSKDVLIEKSIQNAKIIVKAQRLENEIKIEISDNGGGIIKENIESIFNPYFTTKNEKNGTGLGLYLSKTIVDKHLNGSISVDNVSDGASFSIVLPVSIEEGDELL